MAVSAGVGGWEVNSQLRRAAGFFCFAAGLCLGVGTSAAHLEDAQPRLLLNHFPTYLVCLVLVVAGVILLSPRERPQ